MVEKLRSRVTLNDSLFSFSHSKDPFKIQSPLRIFSKFYRLFLQENNNREQIKAKVISVTQSGFLVIVYINN